MIMLSILAYQYAFSQAAPVAADFGKLNWLQGNRIKATISGNGKTVDFVFEKHQPAI